MFIYLIIVVLTCLVLTLRSLHTSRPAGPRCGAALVRLTWQVAALDASQVRVDPEQLPHLVVDGQSDGFPQTAEEQNLTLRPVQRRPLDLGRAIQQVGEVHVPAEPERGTTTAGFWVVQWQLLFSSLNICRLHSSTTQWPRDYCAKESLQLLLQTSGPAPPSCDGLQELHQDQNQQREQITEIQDRRWTTPVLLKRVNKTMRRISELKLLTSPGATSNHRVQTEAAGTEPEYSGTRVLWYQRTLLTDYFIKHCQQEHSHPSLYLSSIFPCMYMKNKEKINYVSQDALRYQASHHWASNFGLHETFSSLKTFGINSATVTSSPWQQQLRLMGNVVLRYNK